MFILVFVFVPCTRFLLIYCIPVLEGSGGGGFLVRWCPGQDGSVRPESWEGTGDGPGNPRGVYKGMPFFMHEISNAWALNVPVSTD